MATDNIELTRDSAVLLSEMYDDFKNRRKSGSSREEARRFLPFFWKDMKKLSNYTDEDIRACIQELKRKGIVEADILGNATLTDDGISFSELKLKRFLKEVFGIVTGSASAIK